MASLKNHSRRIWLTLGLALGVLGLSLAGWRGDASASTLTMTSTPPTFTSHWLSHNPPSVETTLPDGVALADFDNDGDTDFAVGNVYAYFNQPIEVYRNNGDGTFALQWRGTRPGHNSQVAWGDFDRDGDLDLFQPSMEDSGQWGMGWLKNNGAGNWDTVGQFIVIPIASVSFASVADLDNDGDLDVVATFGRFIAALNDGTGQFTITTNEAIEPFVPRNTLGDVNGDGRTDAVFIQITGAGAVADIRLGDGAGSFTPGGTILDSSYQLMLSLADVDGDHDLDLAMDGRLHLNDGMGHFTSQPQLIPDGVYCYSSDFGDYDGDGDLDLLVNGYINDGYNRVLIHENNGAGGFTNVTTMDFALRQRYYGSARWLNANNDGSLDFIAGVAAEGGSNGGNQGYVEVFRRVSVDGDNDGVPDASDNCPNTPNPGQENNDGDTLGDVCDPDDDNDGVADTADNCPLVANASQANYDRDAQGDACDNDDDNDGVPDASDVFPRGSLSPTVTINGCNTGVPNYVFPNGASFNDLIAQCAAGAKNHGQFVSCVTQLANDWRKAGLITNNQKTAIMNCLN